MYVEKVHLINFRNYKSESIDFCNGVNVLVGDNAQGKTNILESMYYCSLGKSHRTNKDKELIKWDEDNAYISLKVIKKRLDKKIDIKIFKEGKKGININSIKLNKISDLIGIFNVVMFSPEDLEIVKGSPSNRRKFLDIELCKLDKKYYFYLGQYKKVLDERNTLLKKINKNNKILDVYDEQLSDFGSYVIKKRVDYIRMLNEEGKSVHKNITSQVEYIEFKYITPIKELESYESIKKFFLYLLKENKQSDLERKNTSIGPHREDFSIKINNISTRDFGSQGQQRTSVLTIKFASLFIIKKVTGEYPVLLLDDVLSELDVTRQKYVLSSIKDVQTIITCTGIENINKYVKGDSKVFNIRNGKICL